MPSQRNLREASRKTATSGRKLSQPHSYWRAKRPNYALRAEKPLAESGREMTGTDVCR
jgi:hypothetical protein